MPDPDNSSDTTVGGSSSAITLGHTIATQDNDRLLLVFFFARGSSNAGSKVSSVQYNGTSATGQLTPDIEVNRFSNFVNLQCFYWLEANLPSNGSPTSHNVTGTTGSAAFGTGVQAVSVTSAEQTTPGTGRNSSASDSGDSTVTISVGTPGGVISIQLQAGDGPTASTSSSRNVLLSAGDDRRLFVAVGLEQSGSTEVVSSMTFGGNSLSLVTDGTDTAEVSGDFAYLTWYQLQETNMPSNGSQSLVVNLSGSRQHGVYWFILEDVDQTTNIDDVVTNFNNGTASSISANLSISNQDSLILSECYKNDTGGGAYTHTLAGSSVSSDWDQDHTDGGSRWLGAHRILTTQTGTQAVTHSDGSSSRQAMVALSIEASGGAGGSVDTMIIDCVGVWHSVSITGVTPTAGQTELEDTGPSGADRMGVGYEDVTSSGDYDQTWDWTDTANLYAAFAVSINDIDAAVITDGPVVMEIANMAAGTGDASFNHTITNKENRGVIVLVDDEGTSHPSGITYGGVSMTLVESAISSVGIGNASSHWLILDADIPSGSTHAVVASGADSGFRIRAIELNNLEQVVPISPRIDDADSGAVSTMTATATAPGGFSLAIGIAGHGNDITDFDSPPSGTGTWTRFFDEINPPTSAWFVGAYQHLTASGTINYTETSSSAWNRASSCLVIYRAFSQKQVDTFWPYNF